MSTTTYYCALPASTVDDLPPSPRVYLRADRRGDATPDGGPLTWPDLSGHGAAVRFPQPPTAAPWAGGQGLYFDGQQASEPLELGGPAPAAYTVALVLQAADGEAGMPLGFGPDLARANDLWCVGNSFGLNTFSNDVTGIGSADAALGQPTLVVAELHSAHVGGFRLWLNSRPQPLASHRAAPTDRPLGTVLGLGGSGYRDQGAYAWRGWLGLVAVYDRVLTAAERTQLHLAARRQFPALPAYMPLPGQTPEPAPPTTADVPAWPLGWWRTAGGLAYDELGQLAGWTDRSGHGRTIAVEAGQAAPSGQAWAGGLALYFDGRQRLAPLDLGGAAPAVLTAALLLQRAPGASDTMPIHFGAGNAQDLWLLNGRFGLNTYNTDIYGIDQVAALDQPVLVVAEVHSSQPGQFRLWLNGVPQALAQQQNTPNAVALDSVVRLGGNPGWLWHGWLAEALLYDRVLDEAEHAQLTSYARGRYALPEPA